MKTLKEKSLIPQMSYEDIRKEYTTVSFLSFERAIEETNEYAGIAQKVAGYYITEQGINIVWKK